jgi:hypothetical protein
MRGLDIVPVSSPVSNSTLDEYEGAFEPRKIYGWLFECHGFWHNLALIVFSSMFVLYLASHSKKSFAKLSQGRSYIMISYYGVLWLVSVLNLAWCSLQAWECTPGKEMPWNILSLFTTTGMLFLEVSLMAFLLQGNHASGLEALTRTFVVSGVIVGLDLLLKCPLFRQCISLDLQFLCSLRTMTIHTGLNGACGLSTSYCLLLYMASFYSSTTQDGERGYLQDLRFTTIIVMFSLNAIALFACALTGQGAGFGFWLYDVTVICYHAFYLPLLYVTFLADFFQEEDLHLENVYYSEMKDAGFFDADWE